MLLKRFAMVAPVAAVCFLGACADFGVPAMSQGQQDSSDTVARIPPDNPFLDGKLVGDWRDYYGDDCEGIDMTKFTADGEMVIGGFLKVGDFWIESWEKIGTWRTDSGTLYIKDNPMNDSAETAYRYSVSGNTVNFPGFPCGWTICASVLKRDDAAATKERLSRSGEVRGQDPALYVSANHGYIDMLWRLDGNRSEIIDFDMMWFWDGRRYFGDGWYYDDDYLSGGYGGYYDDYDRYFDPVWFTVGGSRLYLVLMDYGCEVGETVELAYSVTGSGSDAVLRIGDDDWRPAECEDCLEGNAGIYKARQNKKAARNRRKVFGRMWRGLAGTR
jgi:hypothetical protein